MMLTTAAEAVCAAARRLPAGVALATGLGAACTRATAGLAGVGESSHCGLSVSTTKYAASRTVTDWEKTSQIRFMVAF